MLSAAYLGVICKRNVPIAGNDFWFIRAGQNCGVRQSADTPCIVWPRGAPLMAEKVSGAFHLGFAKPKSRKAKSGKEAKPGKMNKLFSSGVVPNGLGDSVRVSCRRSPSGVSALRRAYNKRIMSFAYGSLGRLTATRRAAPYAGRYMQKECANSR